MAVPVNMSTQKLMRKSRGHFVFLQSARGLAHSKTLRARHPEKDRHEFHPASPSFAEASELNR